MMKKVWLAFLLGLCGCNNSPQQVWQRELPPGATEIRELKHSEDQVFPSWVEFKWRGKKWLYGWNGSGQSSRTVMVELHDE